MDIIYFRATWQFKANSFRTCICDLECNRVSTSRGITIILLMKPTWYKNAHNTNIVLAGSRKKLLTVQIKHENVIMYDKRDSVMHVSERHLMMKHCGRRSCSISDRRAQLKRRYEVGGEEHRRPLELRYNWLTWETERETLHIYITLLISHDLCTSLQSLYWYSLSALVRISSKPLRIKLLKLIKPEAINLKPL